MSENFIDTGGFCPCVAVKFSCKRTHPEYVFGVPAGTRRMREYFPRISCELPFAIGARLSNNRRMESSFAVLTLTLRDYLSLVFGIVLVIAVLLAALESVLHRLRNRARREPDPTDSNCQPASTARTGTRMRSSIKYS